jgi:hypothetical protein
VPSEKTWAAPPTTLMAVSSSMAYVGAGIRAAHLSAGLSLFNDFIRQFMDFAGLRNRGQGAGQCRRPVQALDQAERRSRRRKALDCCNSCATAVNCAGPQGESRPSSVGVGGASVPGRPAKLKGAARRKRTALRAALDLGASATLRQGRWLALTGCTPLTRHRLVAGRRAVSGEG